MLKTPGVIPAMLCFFFYCATEYTLGLWGATFLTTVRAFGKAAAASAISFYYMGITLGRFFAGFLTIRFTGKQLIRGGVCGIVLGALLLAFPLGRAPAYIALARVGFGCSPIYPSMMQLTPERFGEANSAKIIGLEMVSAYIGPLTLPPLLGLIAANTTMYAVPAALALFALMIALLTPLCGKKVQST
jgi:fucose permease